MLKMVLADDEAIVRDGLRQIINWEQFGIEISAEAADGQEAVDLCLKLSPDILFTDIRMPFLDGLEVAAILKEQGKEIKVILFSGIQDFGYAKSALNINAEGYILKPLDLAELTEVVTKVTAKINNEKNMAEMVQQLKLQLNENFGAAREKFLRQLILGPGRSETEILEKLAYFKNPLAAAQPISIAVLQIDDYSKTIENYPEEERQLLDFSVTNIVEMLINNLLLSKGFCLQLNDNEYVIICNSDQNSGAEAENELYLEIVKCLENYLKISASIGIGPIVDNVRKIKASYQDAVNALRFKFYTGKGSIIHSSDINLNDTQVEYPDLYEEENQLVNLIKLGNVSETEKTINDLFAGFTEQKLTIEYVQRICAEFVYLISKSMYETGEAIGDITSKRPAILDIIYQTEGILELQQQMNQLAVTIAEHFASKYLQKNHKVISEIKNLIDEKYMEEISVNKIAAMVFRSPNYISLIFKRETGETITDYLTKKRMEVAKELLKNSDSKILDIANSVGFQDASYFSKVFKKYCGIHPQKYRGTNGTI